MNELENWRGKSAWIIFVEANLLLPFGGFCCSYAAFKNLIWVLRGDEKVRS